MIPTPNKEGSLTNSPPKKKVQQIEQPTTPVNPTVTVSRKSIELPQLEEGINQLPTTPLSKVNASKISIPTQSTPQEKKSKQKKLPKSPPKKKVQQIEQPTTPVKQTVTASRKSIESPQLEEGTNQLPTTPVSKMHPPKISILTQSTPQEKKSKKKKLPKSSSEKKGEQIEEQPTTPVIKSTITVPKPLPKNNFWLLAGGVALVVTLFSLIAFVMEAPKKNPSKESSER